MKKKRGEEKKKRKKKKKKRKGMESMELVRMLHCSRFERRFSRSSTTLILLYIQVAQRCAMIFVSSITGVERRSKWGILFVGVSRVSR